MYYTNEGERGGGGTFNVARSSPFRGVVCMNYDSICGQHLTKVK